MWSATSTSSMRRSRRVRIAQGIALLFLCYCFLHLIHMIVDCIRIHRLLFRRQWLNYVQSVDNIADFNYVTVLLLLHIIPVQSYLLFRIGLHLVSLRHVAVWSKTAYRYTTPPAPLATCVPNTKKASRNINFTIPKVQPARGKSTCKLSTALSFKSQNNTTPQLSARL